MSPENPNDISKSWMALSAMSLSVLTVLWYVLKSTVLPFGFLFERSAEVTYGTLVELADSMPFSFSIFVVVAGFDRCSYPVANFVIFKPTSWKLREGPVSVFFR